MTAPPSFCDQVLREAIRQHGPARHGVEHVPATAFAAERIVGRAAIEDNLLFRRRCRGEKRVCIEIGDDEADAGFGQSAHGRRRIAVARDQDLFQGECLVREAPGRGVIGNAQAGAIEAAIGYGPVQRTDRKNRFPLLTEIGDGERLRSRRTTQNHCREHSPAQLHLHEARKSISTFRKCGMALIHCASLAKLKRPSGSGVEQYGGNVHREGRRENGSVAVLTPGGLLW